eukprot:TRINITY_DN3716_c0_g4_i2.p1 TRINITY_DN3716_c0_g4~~TRINITY_DN3716_c0_g4_i2.p1  ORF type:complete len:535 (+),score=110.71 TRINITY_DN3716_c0_g4_i2:103-1605(+)
MTEPDPEPTREVTTVDPNNEMQFGIFSRRKPQNVIAGLSSGAKSAAKGALAGIASVIAIPVVTAHEEGAKSIPKGILKGVVAGTGIALGGIGVGISQFVRGVGNTPEAISEMCKGKKRWDEETRQWIQDDLEAEKIAMLAFGNDDDIYSSAKKRAEEEAASAKPSATSSDKEVADMTLYDQLGIPANATESDIKKAYYRKASACHPDKDPSPDAKEKFQKLSQTYQILSNPDKRLEYDSKGKTESNDNDMEVGPDILFTAVFGSDAFIPYIGKLGLSQMFMQGYSFSKAEGRELQRRRGIRIAVHLSSLLRPYCDGHVDAWKESMQLTAKELSKATFGDRLLLEIGKAYQLEARRHQGIISSSIASFEGKADHLRSYGKIASHGYSTLAYMKKAQEGDTNPTLAAMGDSKSRDCLFELALEGTVLDISNIIYIAAARLFHDNVDSSVKNSRIEGLILLGGIFIDVATQALRSTSQNIESVMENMPTIIAKKREERENHMS